MKTTIKVPLPFILHGEAWESDYDGKGNDLLSGGSGFDGLKGKTPPPLDNPKQPDSESLRKRAIWLNYRALMDVRDTYYGREYGPGTGGSPENIAGREIMALMDGSVSVMLQIPRHFDPKHPYLITAPSSGSRGIYGGIGVVGEWALKRGFAVIYTDKGTGVGYHSLDSNRVCLMNGLFVPATEAGDRSTFTVTASAGTRENHTRMFPHRIAVKHAHSQVNPQKNWGQCVLRSILFARHILFDLFPDIKNRLKVVAAGISNGGLSAIMAAEEDSEGLIDAVVVSEPNVTPVHHPELGIVQGSHPPFLGHSRHLADYSTLFNIFQPCASLNPDVSSAPFRFDAFGMSRAMCKNRCQSLKEKGLLKGKTIEDLARHASDIIRAFGSIPDADILMPSHYALDVNRSIAFTYVSQFGRCSVFDHLCGFSFAAVDKDNVPRPLTVEEESHLFSDQSGIPPLGTVKLINDLDPSGPREDRKSVSPSTQRRDMNLDGALALRRLVTGKDESGQVLSSSDMALHRIIVQGMEAIRVTGKLMGRPTIIVTGRNDAVLPVNHTSRPYVGVNRLVEKGQSNLHYIEVTRAHHVDALNMLYSNPETCDNPMSMMPLQAYYFKALDRMVEHLDHGRPLPPSQVVRPEDLASPLPDIVDNPRQGDRIVFENSRLIIP